MFAHHLLVMFAENLFFGIFQVSDAMLNKSLYSMHYLAEGGRILFSTFARRYLENRCFFLFLGLLRCFSSPRFLLACYIFTYGYLHITVGEFPHSEICGLSVICTCSQLIAAYHVLLRLPVPRHSPYALLRLT